jgi:hypothetical protein
VTCRTCGAVIADKAIICYRCGAPTAVDTRPAAPAPSRGPAMWVLLLLAAAVAVAGWMAAQTSDLVTRVIWMAAAAVLAVPILVRWLRR